MLPFFLTRALARSGLLKYVPAASRAAGSASPHLHRLSARVLAAPLELMTDPAGFPDGADCDVLDLNLAAPRLDVPTGVGRAAFDRGGPPPAWGVPALRQAIADRAGLSPGTRDEVLVTRGASGALAAVLDAFVDPGDRVAVLTPCSPLFVAGVRSRRARVQWVPTTRNATGELECDPARLAAAVRGAKLVLVADPANPLGGTLGPAAVDQLAWAANRSDSLVYVDETFARYRPDGCASELVDRPNLRHRLLVAGSLTAGHGLGGARVGWLRGPGPLAGVCAVAAALAGPSVPTACQHLAAQELNADDVVGPARAEVLARRRYALDRLAVAGLPATEPAAGYFLWADVTATGLTGRAFADRLLREEGVRVGPGELFGPGSEHFIRVSAAEDDGRLREGLARLTRFTAGLRGDGEPAAEARPAVEARPPAFSRA